ncbi:MAG: hypothetical protein ACYS80_10940, partial [Planctomycetota bacterium]
FVGFPFGVEYGQAHNHGHLMALGEIDAPREPLALLRPLQRAGPSQDIHAALVNMIEADHAHGEDVILRRKALLVGMRA